MAVKRGPTVYLYELAWILPSIAIPVGMLAALLVTAFGAGIHVPSVAGRVEPSMLSEPSRRNVALRSAVAAIHRQLREMGDRNSAVKVGMAQRKTL